MELWQAFILAVVEGLTEYLPVSSTGHMILVSALLGISDDQFVKDFTVIVQFGAILSVVVLYWQRFQAGTAVYRKLALAFLPTGIIGFALKKQVDLWLGDVQVVAWSLLVGGILLIWADRQFKTQTAQDTANLNPARLTDKQAISIGLWQCLALIPGVSRSGASIVGGMITGLSRKSAAEFSFLLAVPTLTAATAYKLLKIYPTIEASQTTAILIGNFTSFVVGLVAIKGFIGFLTKYGFFWFGVYRIVVGALILILLALGHTLTIL